MLYLVWNARGLNSLMRKQDVLHILANHKISFAGLLEHKLNENSILLKNSLSSNLNIARNNEYDIKGRIIIMWDYTTLEKSAIPLINVKNSFMQK